MHEFDDMDVRIAEELIINPNLKLEALGARVGLSKSSCGVRRDFLLKHGFLSYRANPDRSEWNDIRFLIIKLPVANEENIEILKKHTLSDNRIIAAYTLSGKEYDAILWIQSKSRDVFEKVRRSIINLYPGEYKKGNLTFQTYCVVQTLKNFSIPLESMNKKFFDNSK